jgi:hypothetical protein
MQYLHGNPGVVGCVPGPLPTSRPNFVSITITKPAKSEASYVISATVGSSADIETLKSLLAQLGICYVEQDSSSL